MTLAQNKRKKMKHIRHAIIALGVVFDYAYRHGISPTEIKEAMPHISLGSPNVTQEENEEDL